MGHQKSINALNSHVDFTDVQVIYKNDSEHMADCQLHHSGVLMFQHSKRKLLSSVRHERLAIRAIYLSVTFNGTTNTNTINNNKIQGIHSETVCRSCDTALQYRTEIFKYDLIIARLSLHYTVTACRASTRVVVPNIDRYESSKRIQDSTCFRTRTKTLFQIEPPKLPVAVNSKY